MNASTCVEETACGDNMDSVNADENSEETSDVEDECDPHEYNYILDYSPVQDDSDIEVIVLSIEERCDKVDSDVCNDKNKSKYQRTGNEKCATNRKLEVSEGSRRSTSEENTFADDSSKTNFSGESEIKNDYSTMNGESFEINKKLSIGDLDDEKYAALENGVVKEMSDHESMSTDETLRKSACWSVSELANTNISDNNEIHAGSVNSGKVKMVSYNDKTSGLQRETGSDVTSNTNSSSDDEMNPNADHSEKSSPRVRDELCAIDVPFGNTFKENGNPMKLKGKNQKTRHECEICHKTFGRAPDLRRHLRIHSNEQSHKCHICPKAFRERYHLKRHMLKKHHENIPKPFECGICGQTFVDDWHLGRHMSSHTSGNPFKCGICNKNFAAKRNLQLHMSAIHLQSKPYQCPVCKKDFARKHHLDRHELIHTGEKSYICEFCGKAFAAESNRIVHAKRVHLREKNYQCGLCDKEFFCFKAMRHHMKIHAGERQHVCGICGKSFIEEKVLKNHMFLHTDKRPFTCKVCGKGYITSAHLRRHEREGKCFVRRRPSGESENE